MTSSLKEIAAKLMEAAFTIGAIKIQPENPFTWAKGWKSPIYNDNRLLLGYPKLRKLVVDGLELLIKDSGISCQVVAATSTAGIPHGYGLADRLQLPFIYVRDKPKDHGMKNRIEGIDAGKDLEQQTVVLIEDLISTGGSSVSAVQAIRDANGDIVHCLSIFSYGFPQAAKMFGATAPFKEGECSRDDESLRFPCKMDSIIRYPELIGYGRRSGRVKPWDSDFLTAWSADPEGWSNRWKAEHNG